MPKLKIGRVRTVFKGDYSSSKAYVVLDRVRYQGSVWECVADAPIGTAPQRGTDTFWVEIGAKGDKGDKGDIGERGNTGPRGQQGAKGNDGVTPDIVVRTTTLDPGSLATVVKGGTTEAPEFLIGIPRGDTGEPLRILGTYESEEALKAAHPQGDIGEGYMVNGDLYTWLGTTWKNVGRIQGPRGDTGPMPDTSHFATKAYVKESLLPVGGNPVVRAVNGIKAVASGELALPNYEQDGVKIISSPDYNTIVAPGFYHCYSTGAQNGPGFPSKMLVFANSASVGHTTQVAFPIYTETDKVSPCYRSKNENNVWEKWRTLVDDDDLRAIGLWRFSKGDTGIDDCNTVDLTKFNVGWTRSTTLNAPVKNWCAVITQPGDANTAGSGVGQLAFGIQTGAVFHRNCISNKWSEWKELAFLDSEKDFYAKSLTSKNGLLRTTVANVDKGTPPAITQFSYWGIYDKNGYSTNDNRVAFFQHAYRQDGSVETGVYSVEPKKGSTAITQLSCGWTPDGQRIARTNAIPADDANGVYDIATVNWTRKHGGGAFGIGEKAPSVSTIAETNDMNALTKTGFYSVSGTENAAPVGKTTIAMHIERYWEAGVNAAQLSWGEGSRIFTRTETQLGGWQAWNELLPVKSRTAISSGFWHNIHNTSVVKGVNPSKVQWAYLGIHDSTDAEDETGRMAMFAHRHGTDGEVRARIACYKPTGSSNEAVTIDVGYWADGSPFTYAPHPSSTSSNNCIATTQWVVGKIAASSTTSDERLKAEITDIPEAALDAWGKVGFKQFKYTEAIDEKGDKARLHVGVIAQRVIEEFNKVGLDATKYGVVCFDKWDDQYESYDVKVQPETEVIDEATGEKTVVPAEYKTEKRLVKKAGERWGVRYNEAMIFEAAYQRRRIAQLEEKLEKLGAK